MQPNKPLPEPRGSIRRALEDDAALGARVLEAREALALEDEADSESESLEPVVLVEPSEPLWRLVEKILAGSDSGGGSGLAAAPGLPQAAPASTRSSGSSGSAAKAMLRPPAPASASTAAPRPRLASTSKASSKAKAAAPRPRLRPSLRNRLPAAAKAAAPRPLLSPSLPNRPPAAAAAAAVANDPDPDDDDDDDESIEMLDDAAVKRRRLEQ